MSSERGAFKLVRQRDEAIKRAEAAESQLTALRGALESTASGRNVPELMTVAADMLRQYGGGPVDQDLALTAQRLEAALSVSPAPQTNSRPRGYGVTPEPPRPAQKETPK